eukprot:619054-Hanusia_phi.AAC.1
MSPIRRVGDHPGVPYGPGPAGVAARGHCGGAEAGGYSVVCQRPVAALPPGRGHSGPGPAGPPGSLSGRVRLQCPAVSAAVC